MKKIFYILIAIILTALPIINAASSTTSVEFTNSFEFPSCYNTELESWWILNNDWTDSRENCYNADGFPFTDCCPFSAPFCRKSDNKCFIINSCKDLTTQTDCNGNPILAANDLRGITEETCGEFYDTYDGASSTCSLFLDCKCKWNGTTCLATYEDKIFNGSKFFNASELIGKEVAICGGMDNRVFGECIYDLSITDNCGQPGGKILRSWTVNWNGALPAPDDCNNPGSDELACSSIVRLSFFTLINIIAVIVILIAVYYLYAISKRKRKNKG